jgi:predicted RNase H-like HicB family nuclease
MTIETTTRIWREGKQYIAHALPLDVASYGDTPDAARHALQEAVELFIATARDQGTLDEVLEECGYSFDGSNWIAPKIVAEQRDVVLV